MTLREEVAQIMRDMDEKVKLVTEGSLADFQVRWSDVSVDDRLAVLNLLFMANNRAIGVIVDRLEPSP